MAWKHLGLRGLAAGLALGVVVSGSALPAAGTQHRQAPAAAIVLAQPVLAAAQPLPAAVATKSARTTANLHLRQRAGTQYASLALIPLGTVVARTGRTAGTWWEVMYGGKTGWSSSAYLRAVVSSSSAPAPAPSASSTRWFSGSQALYTRPAYSSKRLMAHSRGTKVTVLRTSGTWSEVRAPSGTGWVRTGGLSKSVTRYTGATIYPSSSHRWTMYRSNIRTGPSTGHRSLGVLPAGEMMPLIQSRNGWSRVKSSRGTGWVKGTLLTNLATKAPPHLQPVTSRMLGAVKRNFPTAYSSVGTVREGSVGHRLGLGADLMITNWSAASGIDNGNRIVDYMIRNQKALAIDYIIWRDRIWLSQDRQWGPYSMGGWGRHLSPRGWNATTLHYDHIHVDTFVAR